MAIIAQNTFTLKRLAKDAVTYYLVPSVNIVRRSGTTNVPASVSCVKMKQVGSDAAAVTTDHTLYKSIDGGADSAYSGAVTVGTANTITFRLKDGGGTVIASSTVVVLEDELFSKNDIAQQLGYADWAAMVAAKTGGNPIITAAGLINANIIDVETLAALEAFIAKLVTRQLQSAADIRQSSIVIHSPDPEDEDDEAYIRVGNTGFYIKLSVSGDEYPDIIPKISIRWNDDNHISTLDVKPEGVFVKGKNIVPGASTEYGVKFTAWGVEAFELVDGITKTSSRIINHWYGTAITGTETTPTIFSSSGITLAVGGDVYINTSNGNIYECQTGGVPGTATWVYIGRPSYSASEVGALAGNAIQYFTQAEWNALTQAQKDAIPLALVQES